MRRRRSGWIGGRRRGCRVQAASVGKQDEDVVSGRPQENLHDIHDHTTAQRGGDDGDDGGGDDDGGDGG